MKPLYIALIVAAVLPLAYFVAPSEAKDTLKESIARLSNDPGQVCFDHVRDSLSDPISAKLYKTNPLTDVVLSNNDTGINLYGITYQFKNSYGAPTTGNKICAIRNGVVDIENTQRIAVQQEGQQCLNGERLKFKDPDILFVANLGPRGLASAKDQYWVRYKAKNSYGAYAQGNMLCKRNTGTEKWERDEVKESALKLAVTIALFQQRKKQREQHPKNWKDPYPGLDEYARANATMNEASDILFTSLDDLTKYLRLDGEPLN